MSAISRVSTAGLLIALAAGSARAQSADSTAIPSRPKLDAGADTNSAQANYAYGMTRIDDDPQESVRAFYWASRIDPSSGDAMYALWTAKLVAMSDSQLASYLGHGRPHQKRTGEQLELDSLIYRAYVVNPFLFSSLDRALMKRTIEAEIGRLNPKMKPELKAQAVAREVHAAAAQPAIAYSQGRFQEALDSYAFGALRIQAFRRTTREEETERKGKAVRGNGEGAARIRARRPACEACSNLLPASRARQREHGNDGSDFHPAGARLRILSAHSICRRRSSTSLSVSSTSTIGVSTLHALRCAPHYPRMIS